MYIFINIKILNEHMTPLQEEQATPYQIQKQPELKTWNASFTYFLMIIY